MTPVFRFAPSPNGRLHLGHAYSALLNAQLAERMQGRFLLRMEDIDITRCTPVLARQCIEDLHWLGLTWEEPVRVQSHHFPDYWAALTGLRARGLVYPCFCTRKEIAEASTARDPDGAPIYPGTCRHLSADARVKRIADGEAHSWRLDMQAALVAAPGPHGYRKFAPSSSALTEVAAEPECWGDVILARKEVPTSYHLSVVIDDALQGITHVVRGVDLEAATDLHVLLQALLGLPIPLYHHHLLLLAPDGDKLSKSKGSEALADLRARAVTAGEVRAMLHL